MKTEEEIVKGLEVCTNDCLDCDDGCPYNKHDFRCRKYMALGALNLIRKQQAEIERLKCEMDKLLPTGCPYTMQMEVSNNLETKIRAEAIKEFWDRLKAQNTMDERIISVKSGDDLVKEMAGDK